MKTIHDFLPISKEDLLDREWYYYDFLLITGDAYVDHPSFGTAIISRVLEDLGFRVAILAQPDWKNLDSFTALGKPRYGVLVNGGNIDSMVAHYTAARKRRHDDAYSPGRKAGLRPDRATIVYSNKVREVWGDIPLIIGGLEASLRRFAHYDYWEDKVRRSILLDAQADLLIYGMGERAVADIAKALAAGTPVREITDVKGTCFLAKDPAACHYPSLTVASYEAVCQSKKAYAEANLVEYDEHDPIRGKAVIQPHGDRYLIANPPAMPLTTAELDHVAELPYMREPHPVYDSMGGVPAIEEVRFSVTHNRGCFGACKFCSLAFHQGRMITSRSHESVIREVTALTKHPGFKGYIHDVGGPTANMWQAHCALDDATSAKAEPGARPSSRCRRSSCCYPTVCKSFITPQMQHVGLLREVAALPGVRQVRVASGVRADLALNDPEALAAYTGEFTGGQLKVAPEHCAARVLDLMRKPGMEVFEAFLQSFVEQSRLAGREQYVVPYMMSAFPGCTDEDMHELARWLQERHWSPQQTQCFIPTPGSIATAMYYCGRNEDGEEIYVARSDADRLRQHRILMPDFGRMPERGGHAEADDAGEGHHREPRRENTTERWRDERRSADGLASRHEGRRDFREDRKPPFPRFDDEREGAPRRDFRRPERDGFGKPGFRQDADKPFRKNSFRRDGKPAFGSRRRDRGFDGPALNDDEE